MSALASKHWGYSVDRLVGSCSLAPQTLTLFKTKNQLTLDLNLTSDFFFLFACLLLFIFLHNTKLDYVRNKRRYYKKEKKQYSSLLKAFQMRRSYFLLNPKPYPVLDICQEKIPCLRQKSQKNIPWLAPRPIKPSKGVLSPPPPRHQNKVFMRNHSYQNVFYLHIHFHAIQTHFHTKSIAQIITWNRGK